MNHHLNVSSKKKSYSLARLKDFYNISPLEDYWNNSNEILTPENWNIIISPSLKANFRTRIITKRKQR